LSGEIKAVNDEQGGVPFLNECLIAGPDREAVLLPGGNQVLLEEPFDLGIPALTVMDQVLKVLVLLPRQTQAMAHPDRIIGAQAAAAAQDHFQLREAKAQVSRETLQGIPRSVLFELREVTLQIKPITQIQGEV